MSPEFPESQDCDFCGEEIDLALDTVFEVSNTLDNWEICADCYYETEEPIE